MNSNQQGKVSAALLALIGVIGFIAIIGLFFVFGYIGANNKAVGYEERIKARYDDNEQILGNYGQKIAEAAGVTDIMAEDMVEVFTGAIEARYGAEGSQASFQWIQEQNPNLDSSAYTRIQAMIEAGRNDFTTAQTQLADEKRSYKTALGRIPGGWFMNMAGYPTIKIGWRGDEDKFPVITTQRASDAFDSGMETGNVLDGVRN